MKNKVYSLICAVLVFISFSFVASTAAAKTNTDEPKPSETLVVVTGAASGIGRETAIFLLIKVTR